MTNEAKECVLSALIIHTHAKSKKRPAKNLDYIVISIRQLNRADDESIKNCAKRKNSIKNSTSEGMKATVIRKVPLFVILRGCNFPFLFSLFGHKAS